MSNHYRIGAYVPDGHVREPRKHRCGKCASPYTGGRADCPNAEKGARRG